MYRRTVSSYVASTSYSEVFLITNVDISFTSEALLSTQMVILIVEELFR